MISTTKNYDVLIVGCGPAGATLANLLRQKSHSVAIFDRDQDVFVAPRAMTIDAESCRIFQSLDVQKRLEVKDASPFDRHIFADGNRKPLLEVNFGLVEGVLGYPAAGMRFHQPALERFLRDDFNKGVGVDTFLGYEVESVDGEGDTATLSARNLATNQLETFQANYIIGADGGDSLCRKYIGSKRIDFDYSRKWIVIDVLVHDAQVWDPIDRVSEFRCRENAAIVYVKGFHKHLRFDFEVTEEQARTFSKADAYALMADYINTDSVEFLRMVPYHFYAGMPSMWRKGRVLIAGDAAHLTSPFSGQGLNMGIRDTANLAFKLDMVLNGIANGDLLDTYQEERWKNCEHVIKGATERGLMISAGDPWGRFKRWFSFWVGRNAPKLSLEAMRRSNVGSGYRAGLIGGHDLAGTHMIQPSVKTKKCSPQLLDDLVGDGFVLLSLAPVAQDAAMDWFVHTLGGTVRVVNQDFEDHTGKLASYFAHHKIDQLVMRPDRYVFDAGTTQDPLCARLQTALQAYALTKHAAS